MARFVLVSVRDREIMTEFFSSLEEATRRRNEEMVAWASVPPNAFAEDEYELDGEYAFGKYEAYANDMYEYDWLIAEIPDEMKQEVDHGL